jgi:hypothetical protein
MKPHERVVPEPVDGAETRDDRSKQFTTPEKGGGSAWFVFAVIGVMLCARMAIVSPRQKMWLDELLTYYALDHGSWHDFFQSYATGLNAAPPGYFLLFWLLTKAGVPLSALSLRLFSAVCGAGAFALIWKTLRRHMGFFAASTATGTVLLTSSLFLQHSGEARFYGLYLLGSAWMILNYDTLCTKETSRADLVRNSLSHALAVSSAYVAGMFSAALLAALVTRDYGTRTWRPKVYFSVIAGWLPVVLCLPFIFTQNGTPAWIPIPPPTTIFHPFNPGIDFQSAYFVFFGLAILAALAGLERARSRKTAIWSTTGVPWHLMLLACLFLAVPYVVLAISWAGRPMLVDRYSLPALLGLVLLAGIPVSAFWNGSDPANPTRWLNAAKTLILSVIVAGVVSVPLIDAISLARNNHRDIPLTVNDPDFVRKAAVLVTSDPHSYYIRFFEGGGSKQLCYVVKSAEFAGVLHRFNDTLNAMTLDDFLARHDHFVLIADHPEHDWMEAELRRRGSFTFEYEERTPQVLRLVVSHR